MKVVVEIVGLWGGWVFDREDKDVEIKVRFVL